MLITIIVMTSALLACNNDNEEYSEDINSKYIYEQFDEINIKAKNIWLMINNFNAIDNEIIIESTDDLFEKKENNNITLLFEEQYKIRIYISISQTYMLSLLNIECEHLVFEMQNVHIQNVKINSKSNEFYINNSKISNLSMTSSTSNNWKQQILNSLIDTIFFKFEKVYPIISNCTFNTVNISNNYGYTEFLKNSFNELNYNSINGKIFMELDPNYGYTFDYNIKSYWSAFEPDQSNPGYYLYGDGERKVNVDAPKGDMEIVKYR